MAPETKLGMEADLVRFLNLNLPFSSPFHGFHI
jgi:hypothetical protein